MVEVFCSPGPRKEREVKQSASDPHENMQFTWEREDPLEFSPQHCQDAAGGSSIRPGGRGVRKGKRIPHVNRREMFQETYVENKNSKEAIEGTALTHSPPELHTLKAAEI